MCECAAGVSQIVSTANNIGTLELILNIIIFGITSSFTHCIGMCGGIAMGQSAMRMMDIIKKPTLLEKIISCIAWEYYIGKAIIYSILTLIVMKIGNIVRGNEMFQIVKSVLLSIVICYLLVSSIQVIYRLFGRDIPKISFLKKLEPMMNIKFNTIKNKVLSRLVIGMFLGLIPCGVVYAAIGMIVSSATSLIIGFFTAFIFGLTTIPGLFILSYSGNIFFYRYHRALSLLYLLTALWNINFLTMMI
jgi:sulfite exporter TauE/SafE